MSKQSKSKGKSTGFGAIGAAMTMKSKGASKSTASSSNPFAKQTKGQPPTVPGAMTT